MGSFSIPFRDPYACVCWVILGKRYLAEHTAPVILVVPDENALLIGESDLSR